MGMCPALPIAMLACARIGAPHTVIFGGFSANALVDRITDSQASLVITQDGSYRRGSEVKLKPAVDEAVLSCPSVKNVVVYQAHRHAADDVRRPRPLVARADGQGVRRVPGRAARCRASAVPALHLRHHRQAQGHPAHHRRLFGGHVHHGEMGLRSEGRRHLLVHGRYRLGDRAQLRRLRPAAERRHHADVRRRAELSGARPLLAHYRPPQGQHLLHGSHGDPRLHAVRQRMAAEARDEEPAPAGHGRRADQSGSLDVVSREHRARPLPDCGHLVADGDRHDHDRAAAGGDADYTGLGHASACRA